MKKERTCGAILFLKEDEIKYLIMRYVPARGNQWDFPKGHMDDGETEEETARREVFEETGLEFDMISGFYEIITFSPKPERIKDVVFYLGIPKTREVKYMKDETYDHKWLNYEEALAILTFDNSRNLLKKAKKFIEDNPISN